MCVALAASIIITLHKRITHHTRQPNADWLNSTDADKIQISDTRTSLWEGRQANWYDVDSGSGMAAIGVERHAGLLVLFDSYDTSQKDSVRNALISKVEQSRMD